MNACRRNVVSSNSFVQMESLLIWMPFELCVFVCVLVGSFLITDFISIIRKDNSLSDIISFSKAQDKTNEMIISGRQLLIRVSPFGIPKHNQMKLIVYSSNLETIVLIFYYSKKNKIDIHYLHTCNCDTQMFIIYYLLLVNTINVDIFKYMIDRHNTAYSYHCLGCHVRLCIPYRY